MKSVRYSLFFIVLLGLTTNCQQEPEIPYYTVEGEAQGTTYHITYSDTQERNFQSRLDSLFDRVNQSLSTYHEGSLINQFNQAMSLET
ncbi:MAG: FAD:protein FMN transferase, partial [Bacteroidetes bacterium]|nr:FAD:protein FMN transferase [Bacteroidota bacterium]